MGTLKELNFSIFLVNDVPSYSILNIFFIDPVPEEVTTIEPTTSTEASSTTTSTTVSTTTTTTTTTISATTISTTSTTEKADANGSPNGLNENSLGEKAFTSHIIDETLPDPSEANEPQLYKAKIS